MSRHRNVRKVSLADDDYEDDLSQSFDENYSYAISPGTTEMYMYKRNAQQQSMSEFIKDSSIQEEETDTKETDKALVQKDEDFMFQMDKEPVNLKSEQKQPDDLDSLILNSKLYDDHDTTLINAEEEDGKEFDLDSLAKMYTSDSKPMEINFGLDHLIKSDQAEKMSTSIDNLLDNFFTNNFKDRNYQRTKSISISEEKVPREENAFSLSDLASEYLSNMTPSSTHTPLGSSLVDLIDHEFTKRLSINEDFEEKKVDLKENLIINKRDRARFSIGSDLASSSFSSTTSAKNEPISLNKIQFVPVVREIISDLKIKTLFHLDAESEIGDFLTQTQNLEFNLSNVNFEKIFNYEKQKYFIDQNRPKGNKILIDLTHEQTKKSAKKTHKPTKATLPSSSSSSGKIKIFDFSIPSPDDIILAKQKFAFKHMRFK